MYCSWDSFQGRWWLRAWDASSASTSTGITFAELLGWEHSHIKPISLVPKMTILIYMLWCHYAKRPLLVEVAWEGMKSTSDRGWSSCSWSYGVPEVNIVHGRHLPATVSERCICLKVHSRLRQVKEHHSSNLAEKFSELETTELPHLTDQMTNQLTNWPTDRSEYFSFPRLWKNFYVYQ